MPLLIIRNDITKVQADAIVNTANTNLLQGSGTSRAIYLAAGEEKLTKACEKIGHCDFGKAVITEGFGLPAKYIIHAVGPVWLDGQANEKEILFSAYTEALKLAKEYALGSIAFPLISTGNYKYPKEEALKVAVSAIERFLKHNDMLVYLVVYDKKALAISKTVFDSVEEYIDEHYVQDNDEDFAEMTAPRLADANKQTTYVPYCQKSSILQEGTSYNARDLDELIRKREETFSQMLLRLIDEREMTDAQAYRKANVDRKLFSKIRSNEFYTPSKKTIFSFAIALELSLEETNELLSKAGFTFSNCSKFDVVISYFIEKKKYDIFEINEVLFQYDLPILGGM